jgi:CRISPR-associated protein Csc3
MTRNRETEAQVILVNQILSEDYYVLPPDDDVVRLGELVRTYYIFLNKHFPQAIAEAWTYIYDLLGFPLEMEDQNLRPCYDAFDALYDRGYIIGRELAKAGRDFDEIYHLILNDGSRLLESSSVASKFGVLTDYVRKYVDFSFAAERGGSFAANLEHYVAANHEQCSTCGSEFDTNLWMAADVPPNIKVQYFSNRLEGGSAREPKRRVCAICRIQYILDKLCYNVVRDTKTVFIHLYPTSFFTDTFIHAFRHAQESFRHPDFASVLLKNDEALRRYREETRLTLSFIRTKVNGNPLPKFSEAVGNILTIPVNAPGDNDTEQMLFALENALLYQRFLGCRAVLTDSSIPLFSGNEFSHFFVDNIPPAFRGWLPNNNLNSEATQLAFDQLLKLHQVRSEIGSIETRDLVKLIRSLNRDALELYYVAHKLIKNVKAGQDALQFTIMRKTAAPIATVVAQKGGEPIMSHIKDLARIAWDGRLKGESLKDNSLAKPLDVAFESLERWNKDRETSEEARAIMSKEIARAIERLNPRFFGLTKLEKIAEFVNILFDRIYSEVYQGHLYELLENQKRIRAAYLYFIADMIPRSEKTKEEQQS